MAKRDAAVSAWEALFRAQVSVMRILAAEFPGDDISMNEYDVMFTLSRGPDRTLKLRDLNTEVLLTQPSVSRLIDRLVTRGFVTKCVDPNDGRGAVITLTDAGFGVFRRIAVSHMNSIEAHLSSALTDAELAQLEALSRKLRDGVAEQD